MSAWTAAPADFAPPDRVHRLLDDAGAAWLVTVSAVTGDLMIQAAAGNPRDPDALTMKEEDRIFAQLPTEQLSRDVGGPDFGLDLRGDRVQLCGLTF